MRKRAGCASCFNISAAWTTASGAMFSSAQVGFDVFMPSNIFNNYHMSIIYLSGLG